MARAIYLTHPEVVIDPKVPTPDWGLNATGAARVAALAARIPNAPVHVVSSAERKALETAWPLAAKIGTPVEVRRAMHANDRSATGFLPGPEFETVADAFFRAPNTSVRGWEPAAVAQARILTEVAIVLGKTRGPVLFTGHGAVGTLLYCALAGLPIDRCWDQSGGGHWFAFDTVTRQPEDHWSPMEALFS